MIYIRSDWFTRPVIVISGYLKGLIGRLWEYEHSIGDEPRCKIIFNNNDSGTWVYEYQIRFLDCVDDLMRDGIQIFREDGTYKNAFEIVNELKEKFDMTNPTIRNDAYSSLLNYTLCNDGNGYYMSTSSSKGESRRIKDVNILVPDKVVEVTFADGTKEKAVCREPDVFSLETAIAICISKKIMGGSSTYNNAVKRGVKVYEDKFKEAEKAKAEEERIAKKRAKRLEYKKNKEAKKKAQEREEKIEIHKEAYKRAIEEMKNIPEIEGK